MIYIQIPPTCSDIIGHNNNIKYIYFYGDNEEDNYE